MSQENSQTPNPLDSFTVIKTVSTGRNPVYHAYDTSSSRHVIIKTFPLRSKIQEGYIREKSHLETLDHPNIIQLYESGERATCSFGPYEEEVSYIAIEHAPYGDVLQVISSYGHMPEMLVRTMFQQLVDAVGYLHVRNIAHLDLKVENILIDENFNLKLIDFDLSQSLDSPSLASKGTPGYRAPEFKKGQCSDLTAVDVYSMAVILFIMVTGYPPYTEVSRGYDSDYDAYYKLMRSNIDRFWEVHAKHKNNPNFYSEDFKNLLAWMLAEQATDRPTINDIVNSQWYQGPVLSEEDFKAEMKKYFRVK